MENNSKIVAVIWGLKYSVTFTPAVTGDVTPDELMQIVLKEWDNRLLNQCRPINHPLYHGIVNIKLRPASEQDI